MRKMRTATRPVLGVTVLLVLLGGVACPPQRPQARIGAFVRTGEAPLTVRFSDLSLPRGAAIASWEWSFGDGHASHDQNPTHTYGTVGYYDVTLTVSNANGTGTSVESDYIHVLPATLEDGDRVGILMGSTSTYDGDDRFGSTAFLVPADLDQLTSLGYFAGQISETGFATLNVVEGLDPDVVRVMTSDEFTDYMLPGYDGSVPMAATIPWSIAGLDAGTAGTATSGSETSALLRWQEFPSYDFVEAEVPPIAPGVYAQQIDLTPPAAPGPVSFAWPGGPGLGPITTDMEVPEPLTVLTPFAFEGDTTADPVVIDPIDTTQKLTLTWEPSGRSATYVQVIFAASVDLPGDAGFETKLLLCKAVDDGSLTIPADVMAQLPTGTPPALHQEFHLSRIVSRDDSIPLPGGGKGLLRVSAAGGVVYARTAEATKGDPHRPFLKYLSVVPR